MLRKCQEVIKHKVEIFVIYATMSCMCVWDWSKSLLIHSLFPSSVNVIIFLVSSFFIGLMIYRNEIPFDIETMLAFYKHRLKSDVVDPFDYVQYSHAIMECMEWKGTFIEIRFSWWSIGNFEGKDIFCVCVCVGIYLCQ